MEALVKSENRPGSLSLRNKKIPKLEKTDVLVKILNAGICGTDLAIYHWVDWVSRRTKLPVTLGHEGFGVVESIGSEVSHVKVGDRVGIESHVYCGTCYNCLSGLQHLCNRLQYVGQHIDGVFAEYAVLPAKILFPISIEFPDDLGAFLEPFGLAVRACMSGVGVAGKNILVTGCGPLGLMTLIVAHHLGAKQLIATEVSSYRLNFTRRHAVEFGIDKTVDPRSEDLLRIVNDMTSGNGVDLWIDFAGGQQAISQGFRATRSGGEVHLFAASDQIRLNISEFVLDEMKILGFHGRLIYNTWLDSIHLLSVLQDKIRSLLTHTFSLSEYQQAFKLLQEGEAMKIIFKLNKNQ